MKLFLATLLLSTVGSITATGGVPITLNCKYEMVAHYWGSEYTCVGQNVIVEKFDSYVQGAVGVHLDGKSDKDVEAVYFQNQRTTFIPMKISAVFPNLVTLRIQNSGLTTVNQTTFLNQGALKHIHLDQNQIEYIPKKTFYNLTNLEWISLGFNKIKTINTDMLRELTELRYFSVSNNQIEVIGSSLLRDNVKVEEIFFYNNKLRMIGWSLVRLLPNLKKAQFEGNVCTNINVFNEADINDKLTSEFSQKCPVNCSKSFNAANNEIEKLRDQNQKLSREAMSNKLEKQSLKFNCHNQDY